MTDRKPVRDAYDAALVLLPFDGPARSVAAIVKKTFSLSARGLQPAAPAPLRYDIRAQPTWPPGSDFWPLKASTDVAIEGHAYAPDGRPFSESRVALQVGKKRKEGLVFGSRVARWTSGATPRFENVEPVERVRLDPEQAYGGADVRVPVPEPISIAEHLDAAFDHPGAYPRNRFGMGYCLSRGRPGSDEVPLPFLEDPVDRLVPERFLVPTAGDWYKQPLPWFLGWAMPYDFPRLWFIGGRILPGIPSEGVVLPEVERGLLQADWRRTRCGDLLEERVPLPYYQEASPGMFHSDLRAGAPIVVEGVHPAHRRIAFALPNAPEIEIDLAGRDGERRPTRVLHVVIRPDDLEVDVTWVALREGLPRAFIPGVHGDIPLSMRVDGDRPVPIDAPEPTRSVIQRALVERGLLDEADVANTPLLATLPGLVASTRAPRRERDQVPLGDRTMLADIDVTTSSVVFRELDHRLPDTAGIELSRTFSSSMIWRDGLFGPGFCSPIEQAIWVRHGLLFYRTQDGREIGLPMPSGELGLGAKLHHPVLGYTIHRTANDAYELRADDGRRVGFVVAPGPEGADVGRLVWTSTADGDIVRLEWDTHGNPSELRFPSGRAVRFEVAQGRVQRVFAPTTSGDDTVLWVRFEYGPDGRLVEAVDAIGRCARYRWMAGRLAERVTRGGERIRYEYDGAGPAAPCRSCGSGEPPVAWEIARAGEGTQAISSPLGNSFTIDVDRRYRIVRVQPLESGEVVRSYDEYSGLLSMQTNGSGDTHYLYDAAHHLADVTAPDQGSVQLEHDEAGRLTKWTDGDGHSAAWAWDSFGRLAAVRDRVGASVVFTFDGEGPLSTILTPTEVHVRLHRGPGSSAATRVVSPFGERAARRDALGRLTAVTDEFGQVTEVRYDPCGRVRELRHPADVVERFASDDAGRVTSIADQARSIEIERDAQGRVAAVLEGEAGMRLHRDAEGRVKMVESETLEFWEMNRDAAGRVTHESGFGGCDDRYAIRDDQGRVTRVIRGGGLSSEVTRDRAGRPVEVEHSDETFQRYRWSKGGRLKHAQDADRVLELIHDAEGRPIMEKREDGHWVRGTYGAHGRRELLASSLGLSVGVERDALGNATRLVAERGEARLDLTFERDAAGREVRRHLPGGLALAWVRDGLGRPVERRVMAGETALATLGFAWAGKARLVRVVDPERGAREHRYDGRGRLVQVGGAVRILDEVGNVFFTDAQDDHTYAPGGRLLESYGIEYRYDDAGRRVAKEAPDGSVTRFRYDALGRLVEVGLSEDRRVVYDYDGLGRWVRRRVETKTEIEGVREPVWEAASERHFYWDGFELLHEVEGSKVVTWLWEAGRLVGKLDGGAGYGVLTDPNGIPTELTDADGNLVWRGSVDLMGAFYQDLAAVKCPWRFPGHYEDPDTGLLHCHGRVYDPETGAYLTPNPLGVVAGPNLYAYVSDPMTQASPLGLGDGYRALAGALRSERLDSELLEIAVAALDRNDGAAGPRDAFDPDAAKPRLPDPEALLWGPWEQHRPARRLPPPTSWFTRLPDCLGFGRDPD